MGEFWGPDSSKKTLSTKVLYSSLSVPAEGTAEGAGLGAAGPPWAAWEARQIGVAVTWFSVLFSISGKLEGDFSELLR